MTHPGVPLSHGRPLLEQAAASAIAAARERAGIGQPPRFPFPDRRQLTGTERKDAEAAAKDACQLCGGWHAGPDMPACPRVRSFERNADGLVIRAEFWQDGQFDARRILFVADALDENESGDDEPSAG